MKITGIASALPMFEKGFVPAPEGAALDMGLLLVLSKRPESVAKGDHFKDVQSAAAVCS